MDLNLDFFGIKCNVKVDQEFLDNINKVTKSVQDYFQEIIPDFSRDNEDWTDDEYSIFHKELCDGIDINDISKTHKRSIYSLDVQLRKMLHDDIEHHTIQETKEYYNHHPHVLSVLSQILKTL